MKPFARGRDIVQALREQVPSPIPPAGTVFWDRFRAYAALVPQQGASAAVRSRGRWRIVYAAAAAAAALVVAVAVVRQPQAKPLPSLSEVSELDVYMDYSSVMIVEDRENRGTVIWLASAEFPGGG